MEFSGRILLSLVLPLFLRGMVDSALPTISVNPTYLQYNYQMQITCSYDSTVYRIHHWVHPRVGSITVSYDRFTVITNVNAGGNAIFYRLQISNPDPTDAGNYYCIFTTIAGSVATSASVNLVWKDPPQYTTPSGLIYRAFVQNSVLLQCNVSNYLQLQWQTPVNYPVPLDSRVQLWGTSLYFSSLSLSDSATYYCVTTNEIAPAVTSFQAILVVYELPSVQVDNTSRVVNVSGHASFTCTSRGSPQPSIVWTRENSNDNLVLSTSHITVTTNMLGSYVVTSTIAFPSVTSNYTGVYRCTASNTNGSSYINVNLLLYGTPTAPINVNVVTYNGSALNASWAPPTSNGNLNIISYTVYWQAAGRSVNSVTLSGFPPPTQYLIGGLGYLTNYSVSVVANNARGNGFSSIPFLVSTAATVPSVPVNLTVKDLGSTSALISWVVSDNGGAPITGTRISYKVQGLRSTTVYIEGNVPEYRLNGLLFNSSQTISLSMLNSVGVGPAATLFFSTTDVPEAPPYVTASTSQDAAAVCWPTPTLGQPYLLYRIGVQGAGPSLGSDVVVNVKPSDATQSNGTTCVKVVSLQYEACYNFTLRIENAHGFSLPTYSAEQACTHREVSAQPPVLDSSQSRAQFVTVASGTASGVIGFVLIVVVGTMVVVALATRTRVTKTGDHCLDSINSNNMDTCKHSCSSLAYKTEGQVPNSSTALLQHEMSFIYPPATSTLVLEHHPQHTGVSSSSMGHFNQEARQLGRTTHSDYDEEDDGLTENPAFMQQNTEDRDSIREVWHTSLPPFLGESCSQASPPPMFTVADSGNCTVEDDTMFVENNAYETHEVHPLSEPEVTGPRFAIRSNERGAVREMVEINVGSK